MPRRRKAPLRRKETDVLTVITETIVKPGREADWEVAYRERAAAARDQDGWVELQLLVPLDDRRRRLVVGTWRDRDAWDQWHTTATGPAHARTSRRRDRIAWGRSVVRGRDGGTNLIGR
jgi:heme-degrading monooxygenase HmoA